MFETFFDMFRHFLTFVIFKKWRKKFEKKHKFKNLKIQRFANSQIQKKFKIFKLKNYFEKSQK